MNSFKRNLRFRLSGSGIAVALALILSIQPATAADYEASSTTYLHVFEREQALGDDLQYAPLYEYLSLDLWEVTRPEWSLHLYGWGRVDLGDEIDNGSGGALSSAYANYNHPVGNGQARVGRFFLSEGTATETVDGVFLKGSARAGFGAALFGGSPVENSITADDEGDSVAGGRVSYSLPGVAEVGLSYLTEDGDFSGDDREEMGGDLWFRPGEGLEILGRGLYNVSTSALASYRLTARISAGNSLDLGVGGEGYRYGDLFQSALNSAFGSSTLDPDDEVTTVFADLDWRLSDDSTLQAGIRNVSHEKSDPGDASRAELGLRFLAGGFLDGAGLSAAVQSADLPENEYSQLRCYVMTSLGNWKFTVDALAQSYELPINGEDSAIQVVGSAGRSFGKGLRVSGDIRYTESPNFDEDLAVLLRAEVGL